MHLVRVEGIAVTDVYCAQCGNELEERVSPPPDNRVPCDSCGSTARRFSVVINESLGLNESTNAVRDSVEAILREKASPERSPQLDRAIETVAREAIKLEWMGPTDSKGSFTVMVYDARDNLIAMAEHSDPEEALLAIAEDLLPSEGPPDN